MKEITVTHTNTYFVSDNGKKFFSKLHCEQHTEMYCKLNPLIKQLKNRPSTKVINSNGVTYSNSWFIQQDLDLVNNIRNTIAELYKC